MWHSHRRTLQYRASLCKPESLFSSLSGGCVSYTLHPETIIDLEDMAVLRLNIFIGHLHQPHSPYPTNSVELSWLSTDDDVQIPSVSVWMAVQVKCGSPCEQRSLWCTPHGADAKSNKQLDLLSLPPPGKLAHVCCEILRIIKPEFGNKQSWIVIIKTTRLCSFVVARISSSCFCCTGVTLGIHVWVLCFFPLVRSWDLLLWNHNPCCFHSFGRDSIPGAWNTSVTQADRSRQLIPHLQIFIFWVEVLFKSMQISHSLCLPCHTVTMSSNESFLIATLVLLLYTPGWLDLHLEDGAVWTPNSMCRITCAHSLLKNVRTFRER